MSDAVPGPQLHATVTARLRSAGSVFAEDEAALLIEAAPEAAELAGMVRRRVAGEPLEVILGWVWFYGRRIAVDAGVFVPRRRSEFLARTAIGRAGPQDVVLDVCCGTGALGAVIADSVPGVQVHATDLHPAAVQCARGNLAPFAAQVHQGDLFEPLPSRLRGGVDLIVVNAPYVPTAHIALMPPEAREHEPRMALDGGPDGTQVHRRVAAEAPAWLAPGGRLLIETSSAQANRTAQAMAASGLDPQVLHCAELQATVVAGTAPELSAAEGLGPGR
ncbi:MAG TPA: putative protein N(5)-glutamine methyltransferase [Beutenbergiaceae bacterium]|nr:putative protein N(5)-glutamine methyltransferase [Beutenbergiaceae bacterium]